MFCTVNNCEIYYEEIGEGIPVIMLHGFPLDHQMMKGCMEPIFKNRPGWRRIYFDLPGMGLSKASEKISNSNDMVQFILDFIERIVGDENFVLVGESFGGVMARAIIYHYPEKVVGMFIFCPVGKLGVTPDNLPAREIFSTDEEFLSSLKKENKEFLQSIAVVQNYYTWRRIKNETLSGYNKRDKDFTKRFQQRDSYSLTYDLDMLQKPFLKPSLILTGRQDHCVGYKDSWNFYDNFPRATFAVLDKAGHGIQYEQVVLFNTLVDEWLDRVEDELMERN